MSEGTDVFIAPYSRQSLPLLPSRTAASSPPPAVAATGQWQVILRRSEGTVVLYNAVERTLAVQRPAYAGYIGAGTADDLPDEVPARPQHRRHQTSCPMCKRPFPTYAQHASTPALLPADTGSNDMENNYFSLLSQSHQNTPQVLTPASSRPGTPDFSSPRRATGLDDSAFLEGYYDRFFEEIALLGKGMTGSVHLCQHILNGNKLGLFACKKIPVGNSSVSLLKALKEINNLESLRHPNIVAIHHVWLETVAISRGPPVPCLFALMAYANDGSLDGYIQQRGGLQDSTGEIGLDKDSLKAQARLRRQGGLKASGRPVHLFNFEEIKSLALDITSGLAFLHSHGLLHLDLKAENVLLHRAEDGEVLVPTAMLSDFGSSEARNAINRQRRSGVTGTLDYLAPEAFEVLPNGRPRQHAAALDLWALGLIFHLLAFFALPFERTDIDGLTAEIQRYPGFSYASAKHRRKDLPVGLYDLIERLVQLDPSRRPSAESVKAVLKDITLLDNADHLVNETTTSSAIVQAPRNQTSGALRRRLSIKAGAVREGFLRSPREPAPTDSFRPLAILAVRVIVLSLLEARRNARALSVSLPSIIVLLAVAVWEISMQAGWAASVQITVVLVAIAYVVRGI